MHMFMNSVTKKNLPLAATNFLFWMAVYIFMPVLPLFYSKGLSSAKIGILIGAYSVGALSFRFIAGMLADKLGHTRVALAGLILSVIALFGYFYDDHFTIMLFARFLHGVGSALYSSSALAMITLTNKDKDVREAISLYTLCSMLGIGIATSGAFSLYAHTGINVIIVCAIAFTIVCLFTLPKKNSQKSTQGKGVVDSTKKPPIKEIITNPKVYFPTLNQFIVYFNYSAIMIFFPLTLVSYGYKKYLWVFFVCYVVSVVSFRFSLKYLSKRISGAVMSWLILFCVAGAMLIASQSHDVLSMGVVGIVLGIGVGLSVPIFVGMIAANTSSLVRGSAMGFFSSSIDFGMGLGPVAVGFLVKSFSYQHVFLLIFGFNVLYLVTYFFLTRSEYSNTAKKLNFHKSVDDMN